MIAIINSLRKKNYTGIQSLNKRKVHLKRKHFERGKRSFDLFEEGGMNVKK
jgi:hypothetical protein